MRRATCFLLSFLANPTISPRIPPKSLFSHLSPSHLHSFPKFPSRLFQTLLQPSPSPASDILHVLNSATTTSDQLLAAFESLESVSDDDKSLGLACLNAAERLLADGSGKHEKAALGFGFRALKILEKDGRDKFSIAKALFLLGSVCSKMRRFQDGLDSLEAAEEILDCWSDSRVVREVRLAVQLQIADAKVLMGRRFEALVNLRRCLELRKSILLTGSREMGDAYNDLAEACTTALEFQEALPLAFKALDIYEEILGHNSIEVVHVRRLLGVIYTGLGEYEEALKHNELAKRVLEDLGSHDDLLYVEIEAANIQIAMGRLDDAVNALKGVIQRAEKDSEIRALVFVSMAKAMFNQDKFGDSRRCLEISCGILDRKEMVSLEKVAEAFAEVSMLYEAMSEFEVAMSLMKRTLAILEKLPREQHLAGSISARLGWLLLLTRRVSQAAPFLESAIEKLKGSFGPKHFGLGFACKHLGQAYLDMNQLQSAVKMLTLGKSIIEATFGSQHEDTIDTFQCLANAYGVLGSYSTAIEFQKRVIDSWESHGTNATDELREAHRLLEQLKKKAQGSPSAVFPANTLPSLKRQK